MGTLLSILLLSLAAQAGPSPAGPGSLPLLRQGSHLGMKVGFEPYPPPVQAAVDRLRDRALVRGMDVARIQLDWVDLEPSPGQFDPVPFVGPLLGFEAEGLSTFLLVGVVDTLGVGESAPPDLVGSSFGSSTLLARYEALMDWVVPFATAHGVYCISIGNEPRNYLEATPSEIPLMAQFIADVRDHVHAIEPRMAVTMTLNGEPDRWASAFDTLAAACDVLCVNHHGIDGDSLTAKDPALVASDLQNILDHAPSKELILQELGMPAGWTHQISGIGSTPQVAKRFLENALVALHSKPRLRVAYWFTAMDWSVSLTAYLVAAFQAAGLPPSAASLFEEWFRTSGLWTLDQTVPDVTPRPAWYIFLAALGAPGVSSTPLGHAPLGGLQPGG